MAWGAMSDRGNGASSATVAAAETGAAPVFSSASVSSESSEAAAEKELGTRGDLRNAKTSASASEALER